MVRKAKVTKELNENRKKKEVSLKAKFFIRNRRYMCNKLSTINVDDDDEVFVLGPLHDEMIQDLIWMPFIYSNNNHFNKVFQIFAIF